MKVMRALFNIFAQVFRSIGANKLRSFLTMFGIAWGVASLLLLIGLGEGFRSGQRRGLAELGTDVIMIWGGTIPVLGQKSSDTERFLDSSPTASPGSVSLRSPH